VTGTAALIADLVGVAVFAASGASAGVAKRLDLFGVVFVGVVAALGGGIARDLLIGAVPPYAFTHWPYIAVAGGASLLLFWLHPQFDRLRRTVLVLDAAGLGLFTATGTLRARDAGLPVVGACIIGMITAIGGGLGRDLLTGEIPVVLRREIYAVASLVGTVLVLGLVALGVNRSLSVTVTAAGVFTVRMIALVRHWSAPTAKPVAPGAGFSAGVSGPGSTVPDAGTGWPDPAAAPWHPPWRPHTPDDGPGEHDTAGDGPGGLPEEPAAAG
jgi:uncharacterized membrane protein YeiH